MSSRDKAISAGAQRIVSEDAYGANAMAQLALDAAHEAGHIHYTNECLRVEGETCSHGRPDHQELVRQLREAAGLFVGAMPITPKEAFENALDDVRDMRRLLAELVDGNGVVSHGTWERILDFMAGPHRRELLDHHDDKGT